MKVSRENKTIFYMLLILITLSFILSITNKCNAQDDAVSHFEVNLFEDMVEFRIEMYGKFNPDIWIVIKSNPWTDEYRPFYPTWESSFPNDKFSITDSLTGCNMLIEYEIFRWDDITNKTIPVRRVSVFDGDVKFSFYPQKKINNIVIKASEASNTHVTLVNSKGYILFDNQLEEGVSYSSKTVILKDGKLILSELPPGNYTLIMDGEAIQKTVPIVIN